MRFNQQKLYNLTGVRKKAEFKQPRMIPIVKLALPLSSVYHFCDANSAMLGPTPQDQLFADMGQGKLYLENVIDLFEPEGNPRRNGVINPSVMSRELLQRYRAFRPLKKDEAVILSPHNVLIENYNFLPSMFKYTASFKAPYLKWRNIRFEMVRKIQEVNTRFNWNQYLELELPRVVPKREDFNKLAGSVTDLNLDPFPTPVELDIFDIWQWLGADREASTFALLPDAVLKNVNIIIRARSHYTVLNLGVLNELRASGDKKQGEAPVTMQRNFLKLINKLKEFSDGMLELTTNTEGEAVLPDDVATEDEVVTAVASDVSEDETPEDTVAAEPEFNSDETAWFDTDLDANIDMTAADEEDEGEEEEALYGDQDFSDIEAVAESDPNARGVVTRALALADAGVLSPNGYRKALENSQRYKEIANPFNDDETLAEAIDIKPEDYQITEEDFKLADSHTIFDKSMLSNRLKKMTQLYTKKLMNKHIASCAVNALQSQGFAVLDYRTEKTHDLMNRHVTHIVTVKHVKGKQQTIRFRTQDVDKEGRMLSNGNLLSMKRQRSDQVIRKVSDVRVALTSYYNKTFVDRSVRSVENHDRWLIKQLKDRGVNKDDQTVTDIRLGNVWNKELSIGRTYTVVSKHISAFNSGRYSFFFNYDKRVEHFKALNIDVNVEEAIGFTVVGNEGSVPLAMDGNSIIYRLANGQAEPLGTLTDLVGIDESTAPVSAAEVTVGNKVVTLGFALCYYVGISGLLKLLKTKVTRHARGARLSLDSDNYTLTFADVTLVFDSSDQLGMLIFGGLRRYRDVLKNFSVWDFDKPDVYYRIAENYSLGVRVMRELDSLRTGWVDPITRDELVAIKEPNDKFTEEQLDIWPRLLIRSAVLLLTDYAPSEVDPKFMRYKGYERQAGIVYSVLSSAGKTFNARAGNATLDVNPHLIGAKIVQDASVGIVEEANPIANMREQEAMGYRGMGGRSGVSMVERTRVYHDGDVGVVSESSADSGDVGVVAYLAPDANLVDLFGHTRPYDPAKDGSAKLMSSACLLAPASDMDDYKRRNFIPIQLQQSVYADGYEVTPFRTGYEQIIAMRSSSTFASSAEQDGEVIKVDRYGITVRYADGEEESFETGLKHGIAAGVNYPHELISDLRVGDKFKNGDTLVYNKKYFAKDRLNPTRVSWKAGVMTTVAFSEDIDTLEDGCSISTALAGKLTTQTAEIKTIQVRFDQIVSNLIKQGEHVDLSSILCVIEDPETQNNPLFDADALATLKRIESKTPRANTVGDVSKIEIFYHGNIENINESLRKIVEAGDKERAARAKALNQPVMTGKVDTSFRVNGNALDPDTVAFRIYIDHDVVAGRGDKFVVASQMKSIASRVFAGEHKSVGGDLIDMYFSNSSTERRMVISAKVIGTATVNLGLLSKLGAAVAKGKAKSRIPIAKEMFKEEF